LPQQMRLHERANDRDQDGEGEDEPPDDPGQLAASRLEFALGLKRDPQRAMFSHRQEGGESHQNREPVEDADVLANAKIRP
jgi:hypothetical protein